MTGAGTRLFSSEKSFKYARLLLGDWRGAGQGTCARHAAGRVLLCVGTYRLRIRDGGARLPCVTLCMPVPRLRGDLAQTPQQLYAADVVFLGGHLSDFALDSKAYLRFWVEVAHEQPDHALFQVVGDQGLPVADQCVDLPHRFADVC